MSLHIATGIITRQPTVRVPIQRIRMVKGHRKSAIAQAEGLPRMAAVTNMARVTPNVRNTEKRMKSQKLSGR